VVPAGTCTATGAGGALGALVCVDEGEDESVDVPGPVFWQPAWASTSTPVANNPAENKVL
jgi:hypothetical protein